jgi:hypothetical protein
MNKSDILSAIALTAGLALISPVEAQQKVRNKVSHAVMIRESDDFSYYLELEKLHAAKYPEHIVLLKDWAYWNNLLTNAKRNKDSVMLVAARKEWEESKIKVEDSRKKY